MDHAGGLGRGVALVDHPGARLLGARGQVGLQLQGVEACPSQCVQTPLGLAYRLQQFGGGLVVEFLEFGFDLGVEEDRVGRGHHGPEFGELVGVGEHGLVAVEHVQKRLGGQQVELAQQCRVNLGARGKERGALVEERLGRERRLVNRFALLVVSRLFLQARDGLLQRLHVGEDQLGLDHLDVRAGVDLSVDVDDVVVGEDSNHLADGIALANVGQELVAQAGALGRTLDDPGDVDEGHRRRKNALGAEHLGQSRQPRVGHWNDALVGFDRGERVVGRQHVITCQRIEEGRFSDVGQTDDSEAQAHRVKSVEKGANPAPALRANPPTRATGSAREQPVRSRGARTAIRVGDSA